MKKIAATLLALATSASLYALPIGNPWDASLLTDGIFIDGHCISCCDPNASICDAWSFRFGFYGDYVFDRHFELSDSDNHASIHDTEIFTNAAYLALNFCDKFDIFATFGASQFKINTPQSSFATTPSTQNDNAYRRIETETDFSWSLGLRASLWECQCFGVGGEFQYFQARPDINFTVREEQSPTYYHDAAFKYFEYQLGFAATYRINIAACDRTAALPYVGIKFSHAQIDMGDLLAEGGGVRFGDLRTERYFGFAVGVTLVGCEKWSITGEARFFDEKAAHVNTQIRF